MNKKNKIPKVVHYCWFGRGEKPGLVKKCLNSWKVHLSEYQIVEWNEDTFDIKANSYVKEAYEAGKYAFVSDYARVYALYRFGGIYLDTDVEVFKSFDDLLHHESFWGFEQENYIATSTIGAVKENPIIEIFLESYKGKKFIKDDGSFDDLTNVAIVTEIFKKQGLIMDGNYQEFSGLAAFYPQTYFSPYDYINCRKFISENTYSMHHFYKSWLPAKTRLKSNFKVTAAKLIGGDNVAKLREVIFKK